jgi:hypothetical protein
MQIGFSSFFKPLPSSKKASEAKKPPSTDNQPHTEKASPQFSGAELHKMDSAFGKSGKIGRCEDCAGCDPLDTVNNMNPATSSLRLALLIAAIVVVLVSIVL